MKELLTVFRITTPVLRAAFEMAKQSGSRITVSPMLQLHTEMLEELEKDEPDKEKCLNLLSQMEAEAERNRIEMEISKIPKFRSGGIIFDSKNDNA